MQHDTTRATAITTTLTLTILSLILMATTASADLVFNSRTGSVDFNTNSVLRATITNDGKSMAGMLELIL